MLTAAFGDAHERGSVAAGELPRHEPDPSGKMSAILELGSIANSGDDSGCSFRTNTIDLGDPLAWFTRSEDLIDLLVEDRDASIEIAEQIV